MFESHWPGVWGGWWGTAGGGEELPVSPTVSWDVSPSDNTSILEGL